MLLAVTGHGAPGKWAHIRNGAKARVRPIVRFCEYSNRGFEFSMAKSGIKFTRVFFPSIVHVKLFLHEQSILPRVVHVVYVCMFLR